MRFIRDLRTLIERQIVNFSFFPDLFATIEQLETDETGNNVTQAGAELSQAQPELELQLSPN